MQMLAMLLIGFVLGVAACVAVLCRSVDIPRVRDEADNEPMGYETTSPITFDKGVKQ